MSVSTTIVICAAGLGSRLGMGVPKSLIEIGGKPLIHWQLDMLDQVEDVRVVVGYQAESVIETVNAKRKDVVFVYNHSYLETGTAHSLLLGAEHCFQLVLSLDGDLLVHPEDFNKLLHYPGDVVAYVPATTDEPVYVATNQNDAANFVTGFFRNPKTKYEWSGLVKMDPQRLRQQQPTQHVYQLLEQHLPLPAMEVRCSEIDTPHDLELAEAWVQQNLMEETCA